MPYFSKLDWERDAEAHRTKHDLEHVDDYMPLRTFNEGQLARKLKSAEDEILRLQGQVRDLWLTIEYLHGAPADKLRRQALDHKDYMDEGQMRSDNR